MGTRGTRVTSEKKEERKRRRENEGTVRDVAESLNDGEAFNLFHLARCLCDSIAEVVVGVPYAGDERLTRNWYVHKASNRASLASRARLLPAPRTIRWLH